MAKTKKTKKTRKHDELSDMEKRVVRLLDATWQTIAWDALSAGGEDPDKVTMSQGEVIDMVSACGFGSGSYPDAHGGDKEALQWFDKQTQELQDEILLITFHYKTYGT